MDIMELGAIGELVGGVAVIATLVYLATQIRQLKRQNLLTSYQHNYDSVNGFCDVVSSSDDLASIIVRGRQSTTTLTPEEHLRFSARPWAAAKHRRKLVFSGSANCSHWAVQTGATG